MAVSDHFHKARRGNVTVKEEKGKVMWLIRTMLLMTEGHWSGTIEWSPL